MSKEVDAIIAYHAASGAPGRVTDIDTPGVHSKTSAHYAKGTCSDSGCKGCAVDFAFVPSQRMSPGLLAIWTAFSKVEGQLWELFYEGAPYWIKDGQQRAKSLFSTALRDAHRNHVHVSIRPGKTLDVPNQPQPVLTPTLETDMVHGKWNDGALAYANPKGEVFCPEVPGRPTAKHYGGITSLRDDAKKSFSGTVVAIIPIDDNNSQAGYYLVDESWKVDEFKFEPGVEKFFRK